ncbi:uncharacterized protein TM35_000142550 [Trypanosoma theileri]|uniref:TFIIH basal transcription factor subunit n=1 Tax=Trypanosoma theileri TaxID=67003 RepID=A0A1X0NWG5_9TRYP|nr:uncharacterized protein TM35_000142550 [Trypanosoma theileri]ORC89044.1 hypothetical protein TM35_000142550 [Trypanosoma theileri]
MSQLGDILNNAQISKHYELLQFLSTHANVEYTLAQLDYLIPRGASLQRFPRAWVEYMELGLCSNQSIEVCYRSSLSSDTTKKSLDNFGVEKDDELVLICRRPELQRLEELAKLLQSPSTVQEEEGCVALHTDQVILQEKLLKEAQQRGMLYYFPDNYVKSRESRLAKGRRGASGHGEALSAFLREEESESILGGDGPTGQLDLPIGVVAQFMLYTRRGVPMRGKNTIPTRFSVGERVMVIVERSLTVSGMDASVADKAPNLRVSFGQPTGNSSGVLPIEVRVKASSNLNSGRRSFINIRAHTRGKVTVSLFVDDKETLLPIEVLDENTTMPGVMIGREALPEVPLPDDICINDPSLWNGGINEEKEEEEEVEQRKKNSSSNTPEGIPVLSWWLNPSPMVLKVRDLTIPDRETITAASKAVWIPHQADEDALRSVRNTLREQHAAEALSQRRRKRNRHRELRNSHMLHFGFDASVPYGGGNSRDAMGE